MMLGRGAAIMDEVIAFLTANPGWSWMITAAVLFALDVMAPGFFLLWFGAAAAVVGLLVFAAPIAFTWQVLAFCGVSVLSVLLGRALWGGSRGVSDKPLLNQRARQLIGRDFVLATPIRSGRGRITAGDSLWSVKGPDMPAGTSVRVVDADGTVLIVEAAG
jgi:membrane protein implicated in regulation of membrane protease activity